jgi:hypothetical protein
MTLILAPTLVIYLLIGVGVAVAVYATAETVDDSPEMWFGVATAIPFWPLYVPVLLTRKDKTADSAPATSAPQEDDLSRAIRQVDGELEAALGSLDGWAEDVLARERERIQELRHAWTVQSDRIREMDRLLARSEAEEMTPFVPVSGAVETPAGERLRHSMEIRRQNLARLRDVRQRAYEDLMGTLAWVRELVSMIHLAKFTGAPAARAEELVAQIAAAVEGLSALTWQAEPIASVDDSTSFRE